MAHQCLKCGNTYADGSPQILKGCEGCKGTRFFYTERPLEDEARKELAGQTEIDLERLALGKGESSPPRRLPTKDELPVGKGSDPDWVVGGPAHLRTIVEDAVRRSQDRRPVFRVGAPSDKTLAEWARESDPDAPATGTVAPEEVDEILDDLFSHRREAEWRDRARGSPEGDRTEGEPVAEAASERSAPADDRTTCPPDPAASSEVDEDVVYQRGPRRIPRPVSLAGVAIDAEAEDERLREEAQRAKALLEEAKAQPAPDLSDSSGVDSSLYPEGQAPETVAVRDPGVYELDVKRLLEKNPLVVHRDGSYSLHLPSLMETLDKRRRR